MRNLLCCFYLLFLTSCIETVVVAGAVTGGVIVREKSFADTRTDVTITSKIIKEFTKEGLKNPNNSIDVIVNEQRVLLTGITDNVKNAKKASEICWKIPKVKEVIDEIQIVEKKSTFKSVVNYSRDSLITSQIKVRTFFKKELSSINFKTTTVNSTVYLLGVAKNNVEINQIANLVAKTKGAKKVVSHIILVDDFRRES